MRVHTKPYGIINVDERQKIYFPFGILGFENLKDYVLIDALQQPFYWLQSLDIPEIAFVLLKPEIFMPDYKLEVSKDELEEIDLSVVNNEEILVLTIVTIPEKQEKMTANLQGPIVINKKNKTGRQAISLNSKWHIKHSILEELANVKDKAC